MGRFRDLTGQRFGRLVAIELDDDYISPAGYRKKRWRCKCDCGNNVTVWAGNLLSGHTYSCGCAHLEKMAKGNPKHGKCHTRLYNIYCGIIQRCENKNSEYYYRYGQRGIKMCEEWRNDFELFYNWAINNGYKESLSIDRINNNKDYCPDNCRWATRVEQANNTSRSHFIEFNGEKKTIAEWEKETGITGLSYRINAGWDIELALTTPTSNSNRYKNICKSTTPKTASK